MKRLLWIFFGAIALVLLAAIVVALREPKPTISAPLTLPNGETVRILAVTYGTNHVVGGPVARLVARMPRGPQGLLQRLLGARAVPQGSTITSEPKLVLWLRRATNAVSAPANSGYVTAILSDTNGFLSGEEASLDIWWSNPQDLQFRVFPRRDPQITANFFYHSPTGGVARCGSLPFANPCLAKYPHWQAQPLPATARSGDVTVTLQKLSTGHDQNTSIRGTRGGGRIVEFGTNRLNGQNITVCAVKLRALANTNEVWRVANEEISDATGNKASNTSIGWGNYEEGYFDFEPGLWPTESAWKLRCELKRVEGFSPGETFVFQAVPLGTLAVTNRIGWTTNFGGLTVILNYVVRRAPNTNDSWSSKDLSEAQFTTAGMTNGLHLDLLSVRTDAGKKLQGGSWSSGGDSRSYTFRDIPLAAKSVDFTFAVQRSRWIEFTVKPETGPLQLKYEPGPGR